MKRINIDVELEGVVSATSELEARKALCQESFVQTTLNYGARLPKRLITTWQC